MTTALAEREPLALAAPVVTADQLDLVRRTVAKDATPAELQLYLYDCQRQGVHPLDRLLHFTKRGGKYTPVTSIDLMRTRAADTGEYAGSDDAIFGFTSNTPPDFATVTVYRLVQGTRCPFTATARWSEYFPGEQSGHMWKKMPHTMLAKCAEALALRKGFPRQLAGLYAAEEMDQANGKTGYQVPAPATVVDTQTGAEVAATERPTPPSGFAYLDACESRNGWTNLQWQGQEYKTKLAQIGSLAEQAFQQGVPVKLHSKKLPWLDKVETYKPAPRIDESEFDDPAPLKATDIAF